MKRIRPYIILHAILLLYSLSGICSKTAAGREFLSPGFIIFYGLVLVIMGVYAILWQQVLKDIPLNIAYANKAVTLIWSMIWGMAVFGERVSMGNIMGAAIVLGGVLLMVTGGEKRNE